MGFWEFVDASGWRVLGLFLVAVGACEAASAIAKAIGGKWRTLSKDELDTIKEITREWIRRKANGWGRNP